MKRLAAVIAVVLLASACTAREEAPVDTAAPAMAPAPAAPGPMDTGMRMDTGMMGDTLMRDTTRR